MNKTIDWRLVSEALDYYRNAGYEYVEAPWYVPGEIVAATLPPGHSGYYLGHPEYSPGHLVGSAEQGFLDLMVHGDLGPGKYVAAGPCFRDDTEDELHARSFFKIELIEIEGRVTPLDDGNVYRLMTCARRFFDSVSCRKVDIVATRDGYDLEIDGIEIGSYGLRSALGQRWAYGTGLALPRFSQTKKRLHFPT